MSLLKLHKLISPLSKSQLQCLLCLSKVKAFSTTNHTLIADKPSINQQPAEQKYKDIYNCVYKFNLINHLRLFSRMKIYQTVCSSFLAVGSTVAYETKFIEDLTTLLVINGSMAFALGMLLLISRQTVRVIGRIYLSEDKSKVCLSHLNFMGKRRDIEVDVDMIEPLSSIDELKEKHLKLRLKDMDGHMYVYLNNCEVYDKEGFLKVFKVFLSDKKN